MISCESFRSRFGTQDDDAAVLEHLRACDRCLDFAAQQDPDVMFRALGGENLVPPGGVDAFVDDVMVQVRVREAEGTVHARPETSWTRRLAIAATLAAGFTGAMFVYNDSPTKPTVIAKAPAIQRPVVTFATKPVVESYESANATIVEVPAENAGDDVKIVMIFDENLPADL